MDALDQSRISRIGDAATALAVAHRVLESWGIQNHVVRQRAVACIVSRLAASVIEDASACEIVDAANEEMIAWIDRIAAHPAFAGRDRYTIARALIEELNTPQGEAVSFGAMPSRWVAATPVLAQLTPPSEARCDMPVAVLLPPPGRASLAARRCLKACGHAFRSGAAGVARFMTLLASALF